MSERGPLSCRLSCILTRCRFYDIGDLRIQNSVVVSNEDGWTWALIEPEWPKSNIEIQDPIIKKYSEGGRYHCPDCHGLMEPHRGPIQRWHFQHHQSCSGGGEGPRHYHAKKLIRNNCESILREKFELDVVEFDDEVDVCDGKYQADVFIRFMAGKMSHECFVEIVDKNSPSSEKRLDYGNRLVYVGISDMETVEIAEEDLSVNKVCSLDLSYCA